jgi:hypothetical protein
MCWAYMEEKTRVASVLTHMADSDRNTSFPQINWRPSNHVFIISMLGVRRSIVEFFKY